MSEWKDYKLADLCTKIGSGATPRGGGESYKDTGVSLIRSQNVLNFQFSYNGLAFIDDEQADDLKNVIVQENDVLLNITGDSVARVCKVPKKVLPARVNQHVAIIRSDEKQLNSNFLLYYLLKLKEHLLSISEIGATRRAITKGMIENLEIYIPEINEQTAIASVLSSLDDKIDLLHRQNATLEKMAETLFRQWFVEEAKEEWEEVELGNLIDVVIDNRGKTPPTAEFKTEYPLIEVNALNSNSCLVDYTVIRKYVTKETFDTWFRKHLKVNDIIISTVGTIGVFSIHLTKKGCIAQNLVGLRSSKVSSHFLYCFFKSTVETLINLDIGGVQPSIKVPHLLGLTINLPPNDLLNKFNESVESYFNKIAINQTQIHTLTALRDTLLPKLMSGEVKVEIEQEAQKI